MSAIGAHLRSQQIYNYTYLDDFLLKNADQMTLEHQLKRTLLLLGIVDPRVDRFHSLGDVISTMGTGFLISAHTFFRFIGLKAACTDLVPFAKLQMFPIKFVSCPNGFHM